MKTNILTIAVGIFLFQPCNVHAQGETGQLKILAVPPILIDTATGAGSTLLYVKNTDPAKKADVSLSANIPGSKPADARLLLAAETDQGEGVPLYSASIEPGQTLRLRVLASKIWEAGDFEAELNNDTTTLKKIRIKRFPLGVKLDGPKPDEAEVALADGQLSSLVLRNEDSTPHRLIWKLWINGAEMCGSNLTLPANGVGLLNCKPSVSWNVSHIKDLFKPETSKGHLLAFYPDVAGQDIQSLGPIKGFPVTASLSYFGPFMQQIGSYVTIVAVLILGGLTSLLLSQAIPNRLQRLSLEEQIETLARSTADLSSHVDSKLQVLLRLERSRLRDLLTSRKSWSPDFQGVATLCSQGLVRLRSRLTLAQQMDVILRRLASMLPGGIPPRQIDEVEGYVGEAGTLLGKTDPSDADLEAAQTNIAKASAVIERLHQPDAAFGQQLAEHALAIKSDIEDNFRNKSQAFDRIVASVPGTDNTLKRIPAGTTQIAANSYFAIDMAVQKMSLIRDYAVLFDSTTNGDVLQRLSDREPMLISYLVTDNWHGLSAARLLVREMKDDVYAERIGEQLNANDAFIDNDPKIAYHGAPLELCVLFRNTALNSAAAREEWTCSWNFGDGLAETGWTVSHYFQAPEPTGPRFLNSMLRRPYVRDHNITANFQHRTSGQSSDSAGQPLSLGTKLQVRSRADNGLIKGRSWTEGLKLAAALLIAVFGMVAGAREQLIKLDILPGLIAVFLVGFGADTIKNLLTSRS